MAKLATAIFMIGAKSVVGSNGTRLNILGAMVMVLMAISNVCPSGAALATASAPMLPLAPGLLSTTTACFQRSLSLGAMMRAMMSLPLPGVKGTTRVTVRSG